MAARVLGHVDVGAGAPALVFVHGLACGLEDWDAQVSGLRASHRCLAVDLPGHGATPAEGPLAIEPFGAAVADTVTALSATPAVLVGHSMGCRVVLAAARRLGPAVSGLVLVDGSLRGSGDAESARDATRAAIDAAGFRTYTTALFEAMFTAASDAALRERIVERALRLPAEAGTGLVADLSAFDAGALDAALEAVTVPVLVIQSTGVDAARRRVPLAPGDSTPWVDRVLAAVPGARAEIVPGVGHFTMHEAPGQVTALIAAFAGGIAPR